MIWGGNGDDYMKQRLLIIDDEPGIVDITASYFSSQYEVLTGRADTLPENSGTYYLSHSFPDGKSRVCG